MRSLAIAVLTVLSGESQETQVCVFFSPDSPDASAIFSQLRGESVRPVLLVERYFGEREPAEAFLGTLRVSGEVRVVDDEGLALARRLGIRDLPAVAFGRDGKFHVAAGTHADVKELLRCSK